VEQCDKNVDQYNALTSAFRPQESYSEQADMAAQDWVNASIRKLKKINPTLIGLSVFTFFQLTHVNEWDEIKKNNIPTSLISAAIIIGMSLIMDEYVGHLCEALIPYPEVLQIR
jgi:hypothetical protein